jgi:hypothetical protein
MEIAQYFEGRPEALVIHKAIEEAVAKIGPAKVRATTSQVGFYRTHPFAATWVPEQYLRHGGPPLVLTLFLDRRDTSARWKQIVEPTPGRFTHHVELRSVGEVDDFVQRKLEEAWTGAA